ncbi:MAG: hypothetical protein KDB86_14815 [Actinobacteria bacterium]|nr:hypothetical protein [Actinomycetota bacterium]
MPKWTARTDVKLNDAFQTLGMRAAFTKTADFSGMADTDQLVLDTVQHSAFIEVDEEGTRAAAATGADAVATSATIPIEINRPFLYLIIDREASTYLFMGRVDDPTTPPNSNRTPRDRRRAWCPSEHPTEPTDDDNSQPVACARLIRVSARGLLAAHPDPSGGWDESGRVLAVLLYR